MRDSYEHFQDQTYLQNTTSTSLAYATPTLPSSDSIFSSDWFCELSDEDAELAGGIYYVPIAGINQQFLIDNNVRSGMSTITAQGAYIDQETHVLHILPGSTIAIGKPLPIRLRSGDEGSQKRQRQLEEHERDRRFKEGGDGGQQSRELALAYDKFGLTADIYGRSLGIRKLLVIRVQGFDSATSASASQLSDAIFGNKINLKTQYEQCSGGNIMIYPATGPNIVNGVATVSLSRNVVGRTMQELDPDVQAVSSALLGNLRNGPWDFVMFCLPKGVTGG